MTQEQDAFSKHALEALSLAGAQNIIPAQFEGKPAWSFEVQGNTQKWPLRIVTNLSFGALPAVQWRAPSAPWAHPHISHDGTICITDGQGISFDPHEPVGVIGWILERAVELLEGNAALSPSQAADEFVAELEAYLKNLGGSSIVLATGPCAGTPLYAELTIKKGKPTFQYISDGTSTLNSDSQRVRVSYLQVPFSAIPALTMSPTALWLEQLQGAIAKVTPVVTLPKSRFSCVLFEVKNRYGGALFVVSYQAGGPSFKDVRLYRVERSYRSYVIARTGGEQRKIHVAVVGLGSIGSRVAEHLALAGVDRLSLIDFDDFSADNLGRHVLGQEDVKRKKVVAMKQHLQRRVPGIQVTEHASRCETWLPEVGAPDVDVLVLATGNQVLERQLVRRAFQENWPVLLIPTWVEPAGAGGHAFACKAGTHGCLDCLFTDEDGTQSLSFKGALVEPGQQFSRELTGCGAFTPYSAIDATQTALLAADLAVRGQPGYRRWAGDPGYATAEGIRLAPLHGKLYAGKASARLGADALAVPGCRCCGA